MEQAYVNAAIQSFEATALRHIWLLFPSSDILIAHNTPCLPPPYLDYFWIPDNTLCLPPPALPPPLTLPQK